MNLLSKIEMMKSQAIELEKNQKEKDPEPISPYELITVLLNQHRNENNY